MSDDDEIPPVRWRLCEWRAHGLSEWRTTCGHLFSSDSGEMAFLFCGYCGARLVEVTT